MKKYILSVALILLGISQFLPNPEVYSRTPSASMVAQYTKKATQTVNTYISRLEKSGFSNKDIISTLEKIRSLYVGKMSEKSYLGIRKISIDTIIKSLDMAVISRKNLNTQTTHTTVITNTYTTTSTSNTSSTTITVSGSTDGICTNEYAPVCGRPKSSCNGVYCTDVLALQRTYSNSCELKKANATYLYSGACTTNPPATTPACMTGAFTNSNCICKDGSTPRSLDSGTRIQMYTCDSVIVTPPICTKEYAPVCATPKSSCNDTYCTDVMPVPKTYDNKCMMNAASATYLYDGACKTTINPPILPICSTGKITNSNCICKDGSAPRSLDSGTRIQMYTCDPIVTIECTTEYAPVCGQFTPICATGMDCLMAFPLPTTYTNMCELTKARASFLYSGVCTSDM